MLAAVLRTHLRTHLCTHLCIPLIRTAQHRVTQRLHHRIILPRYYVGNISTKAACKPCKFGTYQTDSKHAEAECEAERKCGAGQFFEPQETNLADPYTQGQGQRGQCKVRGTFWCCVPHTHINLAQIYFLLSADLLKHGEMCDGISQQRMCAEGSIVILTWPISWHLCYSCLLVTAVMQAMGIYGRDRAFRALMQTANHM